MPDYFCNKPFKKLINEIVRTGLRYTDLHQKPQKKFVVEPFDIGLRAGVDPNSLKALLDEEDNEHFLKSLATNVKK